MTQLFDYQRTGVAVLKEKDGTVLLADEQGLGKTIQALEYAIRHLPKKPHGPIVVVVPAHLKTVWKRQCQQHMGVRAEVLYGEKVPLDKLPPSDRNGVFVVNYDILTPDGWKHGTPPPERSWIRWLSDLNPRLLIGDEGQALSNPDSQRTRGFRWLSRRVERRIILTGTPMSNRPGDLWALLNILWPDEFPSRFEFGVAHAYPKKERGRWTYPGAKDLPALHTKLKKMGMVRRRKADVLKDLPAMSYDVVPLDCDLREYRRAEADLVEWLNANDESLKAESAQRAKELAKLTSLVQLAAEAKLTHAVRWVQDFLDNSEGKLLLGAIHYRVTGALMDALGDEAVLVDGRKSAKAKDAGFDKFNNNPKCRVLVGNLDAVSTGWSCTSASEAALVELPWKPSTLEQFAARIHGVGRGIAGTGSRVSLLVATGTIEEVQCRTLQRKSVWASAAIDGSADLSDLNISDQLEDHVLSTLRRK